MKVLVAEDDATTRTTLLGMVQACGYQPVPAVDGDQAWEQLLMPEGPRLALLDWQMPGRTGDELCRLVHTHLASCPTHLILVTAKRLSMEEKLFGMAAGADDYLVKPCECSELHSRLHLGRERIQLHHELRQRTAELEAAQMRLNLWPGLLPICMDCKKIRHPENEWQRIELFIASRADVAFTHCLCPACYRKRARHLGLDRTEPAAKAQP